MKEWILYVILAWQVGPLLPVEQKTLLLQFDYESECTSVLSQVDHQTKAARSIFFLKEAQCVRCTDGFAPKLCAPRKGLPKPKKKD